MLVTEVEGSAATNGVKDIDATALHSRVAARELGIGKESGSFHLLRIRLTIVLIRTHSPMLWNGTSKAAVPHSVMYLPSYRLPGLRARSMDNEVWDSRREISNTVPNQNALEIYRRATFCNSDSVLVNNLAGEDGKVSPLTNEN